MPTLKTFTRKHHDHAVAMVKSGKSYEDVARHFGVKPDTIYRLASRRGVNPSGRKLKARQIKIRVSEEEYQALEAMAASAGYKSRTELVKAVVRQASGFVQMSQQNLEDLEAMASELRVIGKNVNQVATAANTRRVNLVRAQWEDIEELKRAIPGLKARVQAVVNEVRHGSVRLWRKSEFGHE